MWTRRQWTLFLVLIGVAILLTACGGKKVRVGKPVRVGQAETGLASWYGIPFDGRRTANGEVFDMRQLTAAHRTMPFGTWVEVTNLRTNRKVNVRITDRGPFVGGRIIDLSMGAAREIDMLASGVDRVKLRVISAPRVGEQLAQAPAKVLKVASISAKPSEPPAPEQAAAAQSKGFAVQVAAFQNLASATRLRDRLRTNYGMADIVPRDSVPAVYRVLVGNVASEEDAQALLLRLQTEFKDSFVVRKD